jgi:saxitoxin biosynthesis operon SxtJ-like protein
MKSVETHERIVGNEAVEGSSDRSFGFVFAAFFAIVAFLPLLSGKPARWWSVAPALAFLVVALIRPALLQPLNWLWTRLGLLLGKIMTPIVVGIIFYGVITPIGLLKRAFGGADSLHLGFDPKKSSYWIERSPPGPAPESIKHQF